MSNWFSKYWWIWFIAVMIVIVIHCVFCIIEFHNYEFVPKTEVSTTQVVDLVILEKVSPDGTTQNIELEQGYKYELHYFEEMPIK